MFLPGIWCLLPKPGIEPANSKSEVCTCSPQPHFHVSFAAVLQFTWEYKVILFLLGSVGGTLYQFNHDDNIVIVYFIRAYCFEGIVDVYVSCDRTREADHLCGRHLQTTPQCQGTHGNHRRFVSFDHIVHINHYKQLPSARALTVIIVDSVSFDHIVLYNTTNNSPVPGHSR